MKHRVIIPKFYALNKKWLLENLNGPIEILEDEELSICVSRMHNTNSLYSLYSLYNSKGFSGPGWQVWRQRVVNIKTREVIWITVGEFFNKEQAVLFDLSWK